MEKKASCVFFFFKLKCLFQKSSLFSFFNKQKSEDNTASKSETSFFPPPSPSSLVLTQCLLLLMKFTATPQDPVGYYQALIRHSILCFISGIRLLVGGGQKNISCLSLSRFFFSSPFQLIPSLFLSSSNVAAAAPVFIRLIFFVDILSSKLNLMASF